MISEENKDWAGGMIPSARTFWLYVLKVSRVCLITVFGIFVLTLFGGTDGFIVGFLILLFFGVPLSGLYQHAHRKLNPRPKVWRAPWAKPETSREHP